MHLKLDFGLDYKWRNNKADGHFIITCSLADVLNSLAVKISTKSCIKLIHGYDNTDSFTDLHTHILHKNVSSFHKHK